MAETTTTHVVRDDNRRPDAAETDHSVHSHLNDGDALGISRDMHSLRGSGVEGLQLSEEQHQFLDDALGKVKAIARIVGGNHSINVKYGTPGGGSYIRMDTREITIDPLHVLEDKNMATFVPAHEGAHEFNTFNVFDPTIQPHFEGTYDLKELFESLGFASLRNGIEDPAINTWLCRSFPGLQEANDGTYDKQFEQENAELHTPESKIAMQSLGFYPRFAQYISEVIRHWHTGSYSKQLNPDVKKALKRTEKAVKESIAATPKDASASEKVRRTYFFRRFVNDVENVWPEFKKLTKLDLEQAKKQEFTKDQLREMMKQMKDQQQQEGQQSGDQGQQGQQGGGQQQSDDQQGQPGGQGQPGEQGQPGQSGGQQAGNQQPGDQTPGESGGGSGLPKELEDHLREQMEELQKEMGEELDQKIDQAKKDLQAAKEANKEKQEDPTANELDKAAAQKAEDDAQKNLEQLQKERDGVNNQVPDLDKLDKETLKKIQEEYDKLPREKKQEYEERARKLLEDFEDEFDKNFSHDSQRAPNHAERRAEAKGHQVAQQKAQAKQEMERKMEEFRRSQLDEWSRIYEDIGALIDPLYNELRRLLKPIVPEWESGHSSGTRLDLGQVMQAEADPRYLDQIWERKDLPIEKSYAVELCIDVSGSMGMGVGSKAHEANKAAVLLSELFYRVKVPTGVSVFGEGARHLKPMDERLDGSHRDAIGHELRNANDGNTQDYIAISEAAKRLKSHPAENKYIIVITDGGHSSSQVRALIDEIGSSSRIKVIGFGLGSGTQSPCAQTYGDNGFGGLGFGERFSGENSFRDKFSEVIRDLILYPHKFK